MNQEELKRRTKQYALRVMKLIDALPNTIAGKNIGNQLIRSGTSVGANYRAACRARSRSEFIAKLGIVVEEADECAFWLELIVEGKLIEKERIEPLLGETNELVAIMTASRKTAQENR